MIYKFKNDYSEGAHPLILERLIQTNMEQQEGYGLDQYSLESAELIRRKINMPLADVHFFAGGTLANLVLIAAALRPHEAVIAAQTAHINVHETGAIEATGHKIYAIPTPDGKLTVEQLRQALEFHADEHYVKPRLVFISQATELGTVYTKQELERLYEFCLNHNLLLYLDGARLANALAAVSNLTLADIARFTDAFYIGGTKNGALLGEAMVITNPVLKQDFRFIMKQRGALLAKGRTIAIQMLTLLENDLYLELGKKANQAAQKIAKAIEQAGFRFLTPPQTNQIFPILPRKIVQRLLEKFDFYIWQPIDKDNVAVRLVTSWATDDAMVEKFIKALKE